MFELGGISARDMEKLQKEADLLGKSSFSYAFYMDTEKEERERGITIACRTKEFFTDNYHYTIIDAPGHRDFIKNMISGASQADVGLLLVPASAEFAAATAETNRDEGTIQGQSRQHARLINLLGVKQLIVGINKMDSDHAAWKEERYNELKNEVANILVKVGWNKDFVANNVAFIPYSGFKGDNLIKPSENMASWWKGQDVKCADGTIAHVTTLLDCLNTYVKPPKRNADGIFRMPVSQVLSIKGVGNVITGRIESGTITPNTEVLFLPQHSEVNACTGRVFSIEMHHRSQPQAVAGDNVGLNVKNLNKDFMPKPGSIMILKDDATLRTTKRFTATVQIIDHPNEIKCNYSPIIHCRTAKSSCKLVAINWKMGKETGGKKLENPPYVKQGDACELVFEPLQPLVVEAFEKCEGLGRVCALDGNGVVMIGRVSKVEF